MATGTLGLAIRSGILASGAVLAEAPIDAIAASARTETPVVT